MGIFCDKISQINNTTTMKILGRNRLDVLCGLDQQTNSWVRNWVSELSQAHWKAAKDVFLQFPKARNITANVFLFPVEQTPHCIEVSITFPQAIALVVGMRNTQ